MTLRHGTVRPRRCHAGRHARHRERPSFATVALRAIVGLLLTTALLSGCILQFAQPEIALTMKDGYNENEILIPYVLYGSSSQAYATWTLSVYNPATGVYDLLERRDVRLPSGSSGILQLGALPDAQYELVFELLATRDGSYEPVPYLTRRRTFWVDRVAPSVWDITLNYWENGAPVGSTVPPLSSDVELELIAPPYDPAVESPVRVLFKIDDFAPPIPGEDEYVERIFLWSAGATDMRSVIMVATDEAGNRSGVRVEP